MAANRAQALPFKRAERPTDIPPDTSPNAYAINVMLVEAVVRTRLARDYANLAHRLGLNGAWLNRFADFRERPLRNLVVRKQWQQHLPELAPHTWDERLFN